MDINQFKNRLKKLYEYKIHDLNLNKEESVYHMREDENDNTQPQQQQPQDVENKQVNTQPQPKPQNTDNQQQVNQDSQPKPQQPQPTPSVDTSNSNEMMMGYLKSEMSKLDNVVNSIDEISKTVDFLSRRMETLNKNVEEIKEPSDFEKLEMRAFDSYPYNNTLTKVWDDKIKSKEEQDAERMGIYKTDDGYEMEYIPNNNISNTIPNSISRNGY